ncbi:MAG: alanine racemase [Parasporobacterium sp.]|nr:alanine racemase [Parasporobacterium sp.]
MPEKYQYYRLWADVDLNAIRSNILKVQKNLSEHVRTCAVVKADGYGHGAVQVAEAVSDLVDFYAVATIEEGLELREHQIWKPVLVLGYVHPSMYESAIMNGIRLTVYDLSIAKGLSAAHERLISQAGSEQVKDAPIHIKVDTGMSRIGFFPSRESVQVLKEIASLPGIRMEGIFTHFANADDETTERALDQLDVFRRFLSELEAEGLHFPVRHCANSAAATCLQEAQLDMVRLGISMYGLYPSCYVRQIPLEPAMSLRSHVIMVKKIPAGTPVGYGSTWTAPEESVIATIPTGYADGYNRGLSNKGYVLIGGAKYPVVGRVCMDQMMVDVTNPLEGKGGEVREGDEVILVGRSGDLYITAEEISELAGSFNYEFVCGISKRVPRIYH